MYISYIKPLFDFCSAILLLVLLAPILAGIALCLYFTNNRRVFFIQERPGYKGKIFKLIKFCTMKDGADELSGDVQRITYVGKFLRKYSLDELPQLINIVKGELSLIGPRPLLKEYLLLYNAWQMRRHDVKPGITGLAQVSGRNSISWEEKFKFDNEYVDRVSFFLDLKIIVYTVKQIFKPEGINAGEAYTMEKFQGNKVKHSVASHKNECVDI
ncbi:sugar transferase [Cytophagaceae bacterium ABcell3]|nr:sugar transferase [Cytophagaceae bacterium ABcell3]